MAALLMRVVNKKGQWQGRDVNDPIFMKRRYSVKFRLSSGEENRLYTKAYEELIKEDIPKEEFDEQMQSFLLSDPRFEGLFHKALDPVWIVEQRERCEFNYFQRIKRAERKAFLLNANYFATFTYDSEKITEKDFTKSLKKALENMTYRFGWVFMGVPELGEQGQRKHYHFLIRVPSKAAFPLQNYAKLQYSTKRRRWESITCNEFFDKFGNNSFEAIEPGSRDYTARVGYILKYIQKSGARIIYSRNIPSEELRVVRTEKDVQLVKYSHGKVYILFSSLMNSRKDNSGNVIKKALAEEFDLLPEGSVCGVDWLYYDPPYLETASDRFAWNMNCFEAFASAAV